MEYIIGSGAILETGPAGGITPAALHAQVDAALAAGVAAAAIDFEGTNGDDVRRLLVTLAGATAAQIRGRLTAPLRARGDCSLADVLETLARAGECAQVHLFAHWLPSEELCADLASRGISLLAHPLESIGACSVVSGQRHRRVA